jgi:hypothetical protein
MMFVAMLALVTSVIVWLEKLQRDKECACAHDWKQTYMLRFLSFLFVWNVASGSWMLYHMYQTKCTSPFGKDNPIIYVLRILFAFGFITYLILSFMYANMLRTRDCKCAMNGLGYQLMRIHLLLSSVLLLSPIIVPILVILVTIFVVFVKKLKNK